MKARIEDQPDGHCENCRWNTSEEKDVAMCMVRFNVLTNPICVQKNILARLHVIAQDSEESLRDKEDSDWWKGDNDAA